VLHSIGQALLLAVGMFWQVGWSLILGFLLSGMVQAFVSKERMTALLGKNGVREIALATGYGAASSSCSYAAAAVSKSLFAKGAGLIPSLAFLFASTNLVIELGIILYLLMGWQFTAAEWLGGVLLVAIMSVIVKATYPKALVAQAREHVARLPGGMEDATVEGASFWQKLRDPESRFAVAQNFVMDWSMLWKDLFAGFLIAGALATFVPSGAWSALFLHGAPPWLRVLGNAIVGPLIAVISFVCSIGNVPMAAILWGSGISFGGVLSFLYADLIVLPLLDVYRRYYGWRMAAYIGVVFFVTMVIAGIVMQALFGAFNAIPLPNPNARSEMTMFSINYTFWLNIIFGGLAIYLWVLSRQRPMTEHCEAHAHH
jgi:uncharacterized membrane protein YraQ (UPF0718 family)